MRLSSYLKITPMMLNNDILFKLIDKLTPVDIHRENIVR